MTYASDLGLKVGSKIKVIDSNPHSPKDMYNHNDILLFVEDTGEKCSKFHNLTTGMITVGSPSKIGLIAL